MFLQGKYMRTVFKLLLLFVSASLFFSCAADGSGNIIKAERSIPYFHSIIYESQGLLNVSFGNEQKIKISVDDNLMESISTEVHGDTLYIANQQGTVCTQMVINVTMHELKKLVLSGTGNIVINDLVTNDDLAVILEGAGKIEFHGQPKNITIGLSGMGIIDADILSEKGSFQISGDGSLMIKGKCKDSSVWISGMGNFLGKDFLSDNAYVEIWGIGNCEIEVTNKIKTKIMGSGNLYIKGEPQFDNNMIGPGKIIQIK